MGVLTIIAALPPKFYSIFQLSFHVSAELKDLEVLFCFLCVVWDP